MEELELLSQIDGGRTDFERSAFDDFDELDQRLRHFADIGYVDRVVRIVTRTGTAPPRVERLYVVGGLTELGRFRLEWLQWQAAPAQR